LLGEADPGRAVVDFEGDARHANPMRTLHGGILCDVADAAMGIAYAATLGEGERFTTIELEITCSSRCGPASSSPRAVW
jgi:uncharacterized protein (TIGR00369 family)